MTHLRRPSLALLTLNVNGLGDKAKRLTLFSSLLDGPWDVVVLQETHHSSTEQGLQWTREGAGRGRPWPGACFWAEGTTASRGVAILFRDKPDISGITCHDMPAEQHAGRVLRADFTWLEQPLTVLGVYAPSQASDRRSFFTDSLLPLLPQHSRILMGGDFNCVCSDLDVTTNAQGRRRTGYLGGLQLVEETYGLLDAWREQHPGQRDVTHVCASDASGARLDRWLVASDILLLTRRVDILEGLPGDHLGVSIRLTSPTDTEAGPIPWAFPSQLLDDSTYESELQDLVQHIYIYEGVTWQ